MNTLKEVAIYADIDQFKHLQVQHDNGEYIISLVDSKGYEIVKGYGKSTTEAINDMHSCLI